MAIGARTARCILHAPNVGYDVQITAEPLADYLAANEHQTGIMAARPV
jgi:hypothetical protein